MSGVEVSRGTVEWVAEQRAGDDFRYAKIGSALGIIFAGSTRNGIQDTQLLMALHADKSHEGVREGMMAPVCETMMAVKASGADWRPETNAETVFRSLQEELGVSPGDIRLMTSDYSQREGGSWFMSWPMNQPNMPRDVLDTYGACRLLVTDSRDIGDLKAADSSEIIGTQWVSIGDLALTLANGEVDKLRPGVHDWLTQALVRLPGFLRAWHLSPETLAVPVETEPLCDLRFNVPTCVSALGLTSLRNMPTS